MKSSSNRGKPRPETKEPAVSTEGADPIATRPPPGAVAEWFDISRLKQLVRLMRENDLSEIEFSAERSRLRLRRGTSGTFIAATTPPVPQAASPAPVVETSVAAAAKPAEASRLLEIKSPIVGTYYSSSSPDVEPFVKVGSSVTAESIVCIVEAMKVFNEIPSGVTGVVRELLVENGAPVDYGQPLFRVDPS